MARPSGSGQIEPVFVNSVIELGPNRFTMAFVDPSGGLVDDAEVAASFAPADANVDSPPINVRLEPLRITEHAAQHDTQAHTDPSLATMYAALVSFPTPGRWQVQLQVVRGGAAAEWITAMFDVLQDVPQPSVGEAIPRTRQRTLSDVRELSEIDTSSAPDNALHERTVARALELRRPLVIGFATPAFCETRMCGPVVEAVLRPLHERYGDAIEVIHIEPFDVKQARAGKLVAVPAMDEWGLSTEPWVFVTDAEGRVAAKFEGPSTFEEVEAVLRKLGVSAR